MRFLLDTHSLLWFFSGNQQLSSPVRKIMEDTTHQKLISLATIWEMAIKMSKNKLTLAIPLADYIEQKIQLNDFDLLDIQLKHLNTISTLPFYHNDPFDRLIIAQSITDNLPILSRDSAFDAYAVVRIWDSDP
ncbi:PIN domain nuclease [Aphanothece hegewaldii CCALA 016]|uniref:PIN domain nuclease n=1 Tax=Aphanothece hegewaldii CCALA 016 TaxID=2107694 RepID=A0A2T1LU02_9CHRO|nr:type II toxin-antitoxin system VapC family toxin [Aphanothece hegewaldii]PSF34920.1 PIN domain nuclease [Aphanothece hegewaldii CCALA 016]